MKTYLEIEERLTEPIMHGRDLRGVVPQGPPDEPGHHGLDQEAAQQDRKVVRPDQQRCQQHEAPVKVPQARGLACVVRSKDSRLKQVFGAREQKAKDKHIDKTSLNDAPKITGTEKMC